MSRKLIAAGLSFWILLAGPIAAQEEGQSQMGDGLALLEEGLGLILEGLADELTPIIEEAQPFFREELLPFWQRFGALVDDLTAYELPERLPNGDILIRRSPDVPPLEDDDLAPGEIEL